MGGRVEMRNEGTADIYGANKWTWTAPEKSVNPYVQEHTDLPHLRDGVLESCGLGDFWHAEPERLARSGPGHPPPAP